MAKLNSGATRGFNSGKNDLNLIEKHFVKSLVDPGDVGLPKRKQAYVFGYQETKDVDQMV